MPDGIRRLDEHWKILIRGQLEAPGTRQPRPGWCIWKAPNAAGLGDQTGPNRQIAVDLRALPDSFPVNAFVFRPDGAITVRPYTSAAGGPGSLSRALLEAVTAIPNRGGFIEITVKRGDPGRLPDGTVVFEHPENDALGFRKPAEPRVPDVE